MNNCDSDNIVLRVLDKVIEAPSRSWKYITIPAARKEIDRLALECAKIGKPQAPWSGVNIGRANAEIERLREIVSGSATAPAASTGTSGAFHFANRPGIEKPANIAARRARVFGAWNTFAGPSAAECLTQRPVLLVKIGKEDGLEHYDLERQDYNAESAERVNRAYAKKLQAQRDANNSPDAMREDIAKVLQAAAEKGLVIPGESMKGLAINPKAQPLPEAQRAKAQAAIDTFCKVLDGDEQAGISNAPAAQAARRFIERQTNRPFTIGTTFAPRS